MADEQLLTPAQVAARLQLSRLTIVEYLRSQRLRGVKLDRHWRVREADLQAFLAARLMAWAVDEEVLQAAMASEGAGDEVPASLASDVTEGEELLASMAPEGAAADRSAEVIRDLEQPDGPDGAHETAGSLAWTPPPKRGKPRRVATKPPGAAAADASRPIATRPEATVERETPPSVAPSLDGHVPRPRVGTWGRR